MLQIVANTNSDGLRAHNEIYPAMTSGRHQSAMARVRASNDPPTINRANAVTRFRMSRDTRCATRVPIITPIMSKMAIPMPVPNSMVPKSILPVVASNAIGI